MKSPPLLYTTTMYCQHARSIFKVRFRKWHHLYYGCWSPLIWYLQNKDNKLSLIQTLYQQMLTKHIVCQCYLPPVPSELLRKLAQFHLYLMEQPNSLISAMFPRER